MSALGQKQTLAVQQGVSAPTPKADVLRGGRDVRSGPKADFVQSPPMFQRRHGRSPSFAATAPLSKRHHLREIFQPLVWTTGALPLPTGALPLPMQPVRPKARITEHIASNNFLIEDPHVRNAW